MCRTASIYIFKNNFDSGRLYLGVNFANIQLTATRITQQKTITILCNTCHHGCKDLTKKSRVEL